MYVFLLDTLMGVELPGQKALLSFSRYCQMVLYSSIHISSARKFVFDPGQRLAFSIILILDILMGVTFHFGLNLHFPDD